MSESHAGNACFGDSGGPVLCLGEDNNWTVVAGISFVRTNCTPYSDGEYAFAASRLRVILSDIKRQCLF